MMNKHFQKRIFIILFFLLIGALTGRQLFHVSGAATKFMLEPPVLFDYVEIDGAVAGDVKMVGDIDGDSFPDLVIGGMPGEKLNWYRYPNWQKTVIHTPDSEFTTDGALGDVDSDGDLDIIVPDGGFGNNLRWFENPLPGGDPTNGAQWTEHTIGSIGGFGKDVYVADYDNNNRLDVATRSPSSASIFFQNGPNTWSKMSFSGVNLGNEGMASGRVDNDANEDLVLRGTWLKNPGGAAAQTASNWTEYSIGTADSDFKALVVDLDMDGVTDVLFSSSENTAEVNWWEPTSGDPTGSWTKHNILPSLQRAHTLQVADMDLDGDNDVVLAQMHTSSAKEIMIMENLNGQATSWQKQVLDTTGLHNGVVADIGNDGDFDIFGANWTGNPPVKLFVNQTAGGSLDNWTYKEITSSHLRTFGLAFTDVNGDGPKDILSGTYWYRNPGGNMLGSWVQNNFPSGMHAILVVDVDGDNLVDVIAQKNDGDIGVYWLEATNATGSNWNSVSIGSVPQASHLIGAQGYRVGQIEAGGRPEVAITSGDGIYYFRIPASPGGGNWPLVKVNGNPSDEGFALGFIDNDSFLDIAATTGNSKRVEWYKNPGNGSANWTAYHIGDFSEAVFPDRTEVGDVNGDNRLDIIVTEENGGTSGAETYWWAQPVNPTSPNWARTLIVSQATTNSMDSADMDGDGDLDIILGEHRGSERVTIWENDGSGGLTEHVVGSGEESHLGARVVDLDNDGDLDIVSIAYDDFQYVHMWRNDSDDDPPPTPMPTNTSTPPPGSTSTPTATAPPGSTSTPTATTVPCTPVPTVTPGEPGVGRVTEGQQVLYLFEAGSGNTVYDVSGVNPAMNLTIANGSAVSWLPGGGLSVDSGTIIQSSGPATKIINPLSGSNELTLEAWVKPDNIGLNGPARILTLSEDAFNRNFTLGQEYDAYDVRLRTSNTSNNGIPSVSAPSGSATTNLAHVVFTRATSGQVWIYVNNSQVATDTRDGNLSGWSGSYHFALANELDLGRDWLGIFHLVAVFNRALSPSEVSQNYQAGPRPVAVPEEGEQAYLPSVHKSGDDGCGNYAMPSAGPAGPQNESGSASVATSGDTPMTTNGEAPISINPTNSSAVVPLLYLGLFGAVVVVIIGALGIYSNFSRPRP